MTEKQDTLTAVGPFGGSLSGALTTCVTVGGGDTRVRIILNMGGTDVILAFLRVKFPSKKI